MKSSSSRARVAATNSRLRAFAASSSCRWGSSSASSDGRHERFGDAEFEEFGVGERVEEPCSGDRSRRIGLRGAVDVRSDVFAHDGPVVVGDAGGPQALAAFERFEPQTGLVHVGAELGLEVDEAVADGAVELVQVPGGVALDDQRRVLTIGHAAPVGGRAAAGFTGNRIGSDSLPCVVLIATGVSHLQRPVRD